MVQGMANVAGEGLQTCSQIKDKIEDAIDEIKDQGRKRARQPVRDRLRMGREARRREGHHLSG